MKICQSHWDAMRAKLDELGIGHLGAKSGEEAAATMQAQLERGPDAPLPDAEWDPLMAMNFNFMSRALQVVGLAAMAEAFGCPLCHARASYDSHHPDKGGRCGDPACTLYYPPGTPPHDEDWINGCALAMRAEAVRRGLVVTS